MYHHCYEVVFLLLEEGILNFSKKERKEVKRKIMRRKEKQKQSWQKEKIRKMNYLLILISTSNTVLHGVKE